MRNKKNIYQYYFNLTFAAIILENKIFCSLLIFI